MARSFARETAIVGIGTPVRVAFAQPPGANRTLPVFEVEE